MMSTQQVRHFMIKHARKLADVPRGDGFRVVVQPPPPVHRKRTQPRALYRHEAVERGSKIGALSQ
jgi:hypothetical protein